MGMDYIWMLLIVGCTVLCITHPTKRGFYSSLLFISVAILPELFRVEGVLSYILYAMISMLGLIITTRLPLSNLNYGIQSLLCVEVIMNLLGLAMWYNHSSIYLSNYIFDYTGISIASVLGQFWIYETMVLAYYATAITILHDKDERKDAIGNGFLQFIGDTILSHFIRFKDMVKCSTQKD